MALDNVTLFEVNLPSEILGGESKASGTSKQAESRPDESSDSGSGGRSKVKLLAVVAVLAGVAFGVRKFRSGGDSDDEIEMEYERPGVEVEAEAER